MSPPCPKCVPPNGGPGKGAHSIPGDAPDWEFRVRPDILSFRPYAHAVGVEELKERHGLDRVYKLGSNENPLGPSPLAREAMAGEVERAARYPRPDNGGVIRTVASHLSVSPDRVVAGNGSDEIIDLLIRVAAWPGRDTVLSTRPAFDVYALQSRLSGVAYGDVPLAPDMSPDLDAIARCADERTALVFLANPNNPTGLAVPAAELEALALALPRRTLLVVDEAYVEFAEPRETFDLLPALSRIPNLAVMRTFSKVWGMAGLRLGYGIFPEVLAEYMRRCQIPFSVNRMAQAACEAALGDGEHLAKSRELAIRGREHLSRGLESLGCRVWPTQANFVMFAPPRPAAEVHQELLALGVIIRPLAPSGLPDMLRVSVGLMEENDFFLDAMDHVLRP